MHLLRKEVASFLQDQTAKESTRVASAPHSSISSCNWKFFLLLHVGYLPELLDEVEIRLDKRPAVDSVLFYDFALEGLTPVAVKKNPSNCFVSEFNFNLIVVIYSLK